MAVERFPVEEGHVLAFARAIGDEAVEEGAGVDHLAPPTFVQASAQFDPDYPLRPKPGRAWFGSAAAPTGATGGGGGGGMAAGLHAEQHFEYHRPVRVGDVLRATTRAGESWEKQGRSGRLRFSESITEYCDERGDIVVTARSVGVVTERNTEDRTS